MSTHDRPRKWMYLAWSGAVLLVAVLLVFCLSVGSNSPSPSDPMGPMAPMASSTKDKEAAPTTMPSMMKEEMGGEAAMAAADSVMVSPRKQQMIGVKTAKAEVRSLIRSMRTVGQIEVDERLLEHVHIKLEGWIEKLYVRFTGENVKKDQMLFEIYSPDLVATQDEYLLALKSVHQLGDSEFPEVAEGARSLLEATKRRFDLWDITPDHIEDLERTGKVLRTLPLHAPISGYVLKMNLREGMYVTPDLELYTLADLSKIWVLADFYEYEIPEVKLGQQASISLAYFPGKKFQGKVTYIYPTLDPKTRTVKVRFEFPNPEWKLKPGMFANVELTIPLGKRLVVPNTAVLDSGREQRIFVSQGDGMFEPRTATVGVRTQQWYEILEGVKEGETVVATANFLLDSESNLKSASGMMMPGMDMGSKKKPAMSGMDKSK